MRYLESTGCHVSLAMIGTLPSIEGGRISIALMT